MARSNVQTIVAYTIRCGIQKVGDFFVRWAGGDHLLEERDIITATGFEEELPGRGPLN